MLQFGSKKIPLKGAGKVTIRSDGEFVVYALQGKKREFILGPAVREARVARFTLLNQTGIEVVCDDGVAWSIDVVIRQPSHDVLDHTPMEIPQDQEPLSLRDEMRQYIRTMVSQQAEEYGAGTFEEEDDFDIPDEFDPTSPYELNEMQEEYIPEPPKEEPPLEPDRGDLGHVEQKEVLDPAST